MSEVMVPVITIDGPSGSGKGAISSMVANHLSWHLLDSGALYRLLALHAIKSQVSLEDGEVLATLAASLPVVFNERVILAGEDVTDAIRTEDCGMSASKIAALNPVRKALLARQRAFLVAPGLVADGRDMGTNVFPEAILKIYLDASAEERAKRRYLQLKDKGLDGNLEALIGEIAQRDARDKSRAVAPLRPAEDAVILDTTGMNIDEVFKAVVSEYAELS